MPTCRTCKKSLDNSRFEFRKDTKKFRTQCKGCERVRERELYQLNIDRERASRRHWDKVYRKRDRLRALEKVGRGKIICSECGCDVPQFIDINHINGGGTKERENAKGHNFVDNILRGKRGIEDLNLLCKVCNAADHLRRLSPTIYYKIIWKP